MKGDADAGAVGEVEDVLFHLADFDGLTEVDFVQGDGAEGGDLVLDAEVLGEAGDPGFAVVGEGHAGHAGVKGVAIFGDVDGDDFAALGDAGADMDGGDFDGEAAERSGEFLDPKGEVFDEQGEGGEGGLVGGGDVASEGRGKALQAEGGEFGGGVESGDAVGDLG